MKQKPDSFLSPKVGPYICTIFSSPEGHVPYLCALMILNGQLQIILNPVQTVIVYIVASDILCSALHETVA